MGTGARAAAAALFVTRGAGHTDLVRAVCVVGDTIVSGSFDQTIRLWSAGAGVHTATLPGHTKGIWTVVAQADRLVSGSRDGSVIVWLRQADGTWAFALRLLPRGPEPVAEPHLITFPEAAAAARPRTRGGPGWSATPLAAVLRDADEEDGEGEARAEPESRRRPMTQSLPTSHDFYSVQTDSAAIYGGCGDSAIYVFRFDARDGGMAGSAPDV